MEPSSLALGCAGWALRRLRGWVICMAPSILLIVADDLSRQLLPAYGARHSLARNIDSLSHVVFDRALTVSPLCTPSRYALLTGTHASTAPGLAAKRYRLQVRPVHFNTYLSPQPGNAVATVASRLGALGFRTFFCGKWHVSDPAKAPPLDSSGQAWRQAAVVAEGGFGFADDVYFGQQDVDAAAHNVTPL